jgi:hypothetical protein
MHKVCLYECGIVLSNIHDKYINHTMSKTKGPLKDTNFIIHECIFIVCFCQPRLSNQPKGGIGK